MPTDKPRFSITIDDELLKRVDDYRFENRCSNRTQAVLELIRLGLATSDRKKKVKNRFKL